ncbi:hypothetical protein RTBOTA2_001370 [Rhodotorula toruloides]|uniref:Proteophosphoglycan ppg4 n=1 Tax=Rhodotorula toruloides TaxID=5286 RepID=A0A0K3CLY0_RHOTO|nr:hypothetical protein RTBOTA2_001370 [Rhodotorula toruloides]PRQ74040.1 hypothetical protein AAT19DRAFT_15607 [Rhodotorula toruloides]
MPAMTAAVEELTTAFAPANTLPAMHLLLARRPDIDLPNITSASPAVIKGIIADTSTYEILTMWAPDIWAIVLCYTFAALLKGSLELMLRGEAVERAWAAVRGKEGKNGIEVADAKARLAVPAKAALSHFFNLFLSTFTLILQVCAWRLFIVPETPVRLFDIKLLMAALKLLLVGYAADLLFSDLCIEVFLHHLFTFALLVVGQIAAFKTSEIKFSRLAQWLILQATLEQTEYIALGCYHLSKFFALQDRPDASKRFLKTAYRSMVVSSYVCWVQKFMPVAFAIYWLEKLWEEVDNLPWGKAWCGLATTVISLLLILQVRFCDDQASLAAHFRHKLYGGTPPSRTGPVMRFLLKPLRSSRKKPSSTTTERVEEGASEAQAVKNPFADPSMDELQPAITHASSSASSIQPLRHSLVPAPTDAATTSHEKA